MLVRTFLAAIFVGLTATGCASTPRNASGQPLTYRVEVMNTCGQNMRFYVDKETFWRGSSMDTSPSLQNGQSALRFLKPGKHRLTLIPPGGSGTGRQVKFVLQGPMSIRGC